MHPSTEEVVIPQGQAVSSAADVTIIDDSEFVPGRVYVIPVTITHADFPVIDANRTIYLKVSRTLHFQAPHVGKASMAYQFLLPDPIPSLPVYTWEVKIYAEKFRSSSASGTTRVCSFGGYETSVEGGSIDDGGFKCDHNLLRFGKGTDAPNQLHVTTKQGKMSSAGYQSSQLFYVRLSEMRLWTRVLSAREIKANVCGVDPSTNGLVSYWRMNEEEGSTFYDLSPNKRDIAYTNSTTIQWTNDDTNICVE